MNPDLARCDLEIALALAQLRAGHPDLRGLTLMLSDWSEERRLIEAEAEVDGDPVPVV